MGMEELFNGIMKDGQKILTQNLVPGVSSYQEELVSFAGKEYRVWNPYRSKPAAAIRKGLRSFPLKREMRVLYLGAANGHTASFFSDILGSEGFIYAVEISGRAMKDLLQTARMRKNMAPMLANARTVPYTWIGPVDLVYQDIASRDQAEIFIRNCRIFLPRGKAAAISIKSRSIDVTKMPQDVFKEELEKLSHEFKITESLELEPFEKDHLFVVGERR